VRRSRPEEIRSFRGLRKDVSRIHMPAGFCQEDMGSNRYKQGSWKRRRGMLHSNVAKQSSAITAIIGMDLPGSDYALLMVEGTNAQGFANVVIQPNTVAPITDGYGVLGYGEGGYGG